MVKIIAVDMDGTFLNNKMKYNRPKFISLFNKLIERNIQFIVASGNQYFQLKSFFPNYDNDIIYIAENGALIYQNNQLLYENHFDNQLVREVIKFLYESNIDGIVLSGIKQAYIAQDVNLKFKKFASLYYHKITEVENLTQLENDKFVKFTLEVSNQKTEEYTNLIQNKFRDKLKVVSSGHGNIDIIQLGEDKGNALNYILNEKNISSSELLVFGDGNNDIEMLELAKFSYAMENGSLEAKNAAQYIAPSNENDGVLSVIEKYLLEF